MGIKEIPIIYAINDAFAPAAGASMRSLIRLTDPKRHYKICVLHLGLAKIHQERLQSMETANLAISFFDARKLVDPQDWPFVARFGLEIYLRLYAPMIYQDHPKIIYLDADTILLRDIADLYDTPLAGAPLAACWSFAAPFMDGYVRRTVGLLPEDYFNSGVIVIDTARFEEERIRTRCQEILMDQRRLICFDQDALNLALAATYLRLADEWNVQWTNHLHPKTDLSERASRRQRARMRRAEANPYLLHYASDFKPWHYPNAWKAQLFWENALASPYEEEFTALLNHQQAHPRAFVPVRPPWRAFRRNLSLAGKTYALKEVVSNLLRLDGEVPR